ncbi:MAG: hypothetical protein MUO26_07740 [Methanotrichaceae archaeon]|nr:hypothetical protein [Methanotrichaceae archaeon]
MLHSANLKNGVIVLRNSISEELITPLSRGTALEGYKFAEDNKNALSELLLEESSQLHNTCESPIGTMHVDHFFNYQMEWEQLHWAALQKVPYGNMTSSWFFQE